MPHKIKRAYRQGQVLTENHPTLNKGQIVEIIKEDEEYYDVRVFITGKSERIEKKFVDTH